MKDVKEALYCMGQMADKCLTSLGAIQKNHKEFVSLVRKMREAQEDVIYKSMFSALDSARPTAYEVAKTKQIVLEQEVDEYLKKMEDED